MRRGWCATRAASSNLKPVLAGLAVLFVLWVVPFRNYGVELNLLKNSGFEEAVPDPQTVPGWSTAFDSRSKLLLTSKEAHGGRASVSIPANTSIEQTVASVPAGAYLARCWVKSEAEQTLTFLLRNSNEPWAGYTCAELKVPQGQWVQLETFCVLERSGPLTLSIGGVPKDFHPYHGTEQDMGSPILADDFELVRYEPASPSRTTSVSIWDGGKGSASGLDWSTKDQWRRIDDRSGDVSGTPVVQAGHLVGAFHQTDGGITVYSLSDGKLKQRCSVVPSPVFSGYTCSVIRENDRTGIQVRAKSGSQSYVAWFTPQGLVRVEPSQVSRFEVSQCRLRYALLPSFAGTDILYAPEPMTEAKAFNIPSTQWFVGLVDGNDSMLVAAWETNAQPVSLALEGGKGNRLIQSLSISTELAGFGLSFVEHANIWHLESLKEDWLGDYVPIEWERPFPARWMGHFAVSPGGHPSFRQPDMTYSFPFASAKTRMWGVWFEDWNHYPFYFDGQRTMFHFEKTFIPEGEALIYFLEPAAVDLFSPCEIVEQFLGVDRAAALFDFEANQLRKLKYSTPEQFIFDRPVCATTTRLSKIKQEEKSTLGVELATHLYEFIREIRSRVDQYSTFFSDLKEYLARQEKTHPDMHVYLAGLQKTVEEAQSQSREVYATPLSSVQKKVEGMKAQLQAGQGDGFNCGDLDVRSPAGAQDDLCRRYNRWVIRLMERAALDCGDSPEKAAVALHIWTQSRQVLRRPTRWEPRRTLYFFEP